MVIAVDFDGVLSYAKWPAVGRPNTALIGHLAARRKHGDKVILWTCRAGSALDAAVAFCRVNGLEFDAVNRNVPEMVERFGGDTRKVNADVYIDDKAQHVDDFVAEHCNSAARIRNISVRSKRKGRKNGGDGG